MNQRRNASRVDPSAVGFSEDVSLSAVRIFDHLAKRFKEQFHYEYCWSKGSFAYLRKDATSRAIKIKDITDLHHLQDGSQS